MHFSYHLISGCTFGIELVDGKDADPKSEDLFVVIDLLLLRVVFNI
jgi:hypothetical protein